MKDFDPFADWLRWIVLWLSLIGLGLILLGYGIAKAQSPAPHHEFHKDFYRHWLQPGTNKSCCNARVTVHGHELGDCEPTAATIRNGDWFAWNRLRGEWLRIPDSRILRERNPNVFDGHLCWTPDQGVICFVPPSTGG